MDIVKDLKAFMKAYDIDSIEITKNDGNQTMNLIIENNGEIDEAE